MSERQKLHKNGLYELKSDLVYIDPASGKRCSFNECIDKFELKVEEDKEIGILLITKCDSEYWQCSECNRKHHTRRNRINNAKNFDENDDPVKRWHLRRQWCEDNEEELLKESKKRPKWVKPNPGAWRKGRGQKW